jgi:signal transduction histidine kinase
MTGAVLYVYVHCTLHNYIQADKSNRRNQKDRNRRTVSVGQEQEDGSVGQEQEDGVSRTGIGKHEVVQELSGRTRRTVTGATAHKKQTHAEKRAGQRQEGRIAHK